MTAATDTAVRPATAHTGPGDHDRYSHYVDKPALTAALVQGEPAVALCGKRWVPTRDGHLFPVCPTCADEYERRPQTRSGS